jgi:sec-independent protein translocase protein TatA
LALVTSNLDVDCPSLASPLITRPRRPLKARYTINVGAGCKNVQRVRYRMRLGFPELMVILFIVLLIFGANRLPDLAKGMGKSIRNFKDAVREGEDEKKP